VVTVLAVLGVLVVLFVCAAVATRDGEVLVDAPPDRADVALPAGPLQAQDLHGVRFGMALRGYRMAQVDEVLDRLGDELHARDDRLRELEDELAARPAPPAEPDPHAQPGVLPTTGGARTQGGSVAVAAGSAAPTDPDEDAPTLPDVEVRPGAAPPAPVPFPEPVHSDEPTAVPPPPAAAPEQGAGLLGRLAGWRAGHGTETLRR